MSSTTTLAQVFSISTALVAGGGIASTSLFDVPEWQSQPASRSLPMVRWFFSRGSHIFPQAAGLASAGFVYLAINALPPNQLSQIFTYALQGGKVTGYLAAAILSISIAPVTAFLMIPTNFELIKMNEQLGGARSEASPKQGGGRPSGNSAEDSVGGKGQAAEFTDLSRPQGETAKQSSAEEDRKVRELLSTFAQLNGLRAALLTAGGIVGLWTALAA
ncbi:hypothetical protein LTR62_000495 [Meristemomyces frigidus]|uniref:DUF1772-domain-containing protein n=1 Tax=Meristemomyces frigidus TaxID=1508187 RepID=A0AAN7YGU8_9PEZI|nr:hypothetical protein LTR62_000495 [Meristemomyces frigidus]